MSLTPTSCDGEAWLNLGRIRQTYSLEVLDAHLDGKWSLEEGRIQHKSHRFFSLVGLQWSDSEDLHCSVLTLYRGSLIM